MPVQTRVFFLHVNFDHRGELVRLRNLFVPTVLKFGGRNMSRDTDVDDAINLL